MTQCAELNISLTLFTSLLLFSDHTCFSLGSVVQIKIESYTPITVVSMGTQPQTQQAVMHRVL